MIQCSYFAGVLLGFCGFSAWFLLFLDRRGLVGRGFPLCRRLGENGRKWKERGEIEEATGKRREEGAGDVRYLTERAMGDGRQNCNVRENKMREKGLGNGPDQEPTCGQRGLGTFKTKRKRKAKRKGGKAKVRECGMRQSTVAAGAGGGGLGKSDPALGQTITMGKKKINEK